MESLFFKISCKYIIYLCILLMINTLNHKIKVKYNMGNRNRLTSLHFFYKLYFIMYFFDNSFLMNGNIYCF